LATVADLSKVQVQGRLPAGYLSTLRPGAAVNLRLSAYANESFAGTLFRLAPQADPQTGELTVWAELPNPAGRLRPGLVGQLTISLPEIADAIAVPEDVLADRDGAPVVTVIRDGKANVVPVKLGTRAGALVQVIDGLKEGDQLATEGGYGLPDETPVKVIDAARDTAGSDASQP
jgi:RND family efflux transporter MFP subunit